MVFPRATRPAVAAASPLVALLLVAVSLVAPGVAAAADPIKLADERWHENAYGLSLRPPADARRVTQPRDGAVVQFVDDPGYSIGLFIRHSENEVNLNTLKQQLALEISYGSREANIIDDREFKIAGRPGTASYFRVKRGDQEWVLGHAVVRIDPYTIVQLRLNSSTESYEANRALFEAVIDSVQFTSPAELDRIRSAWIRAGQRWRQGLDRDMLKQAMAAEQWFRVLDGTVDVGYMRFRHSLASELGVPGVRVEVDSRIVIGPASFDTVSFFWEADNGQAELWSIRQARRTLQKGPAASNVPPPPPQISEETGVRANGRINVRRALPGDVDELEWAVPPEGYLSQVELQLVPSLLPRGDQQDFGFYAYASKEAELGLRSMQVYPAEDGRYVVRERATVNGAEQVSTYDANGRLIRRQFPDGRTIVPATPEEMRAIWDIR